MPSSHRETSAASIKTVLLLIVLAGATLRIGLFLAADVLSLDESMLALNLATRGMLDLTRPLEFQQSAPVLYLWLSHLALRLAGVTEQTLRLLPLLSGLLLPWAVWSLGRRVLPARAALLAAAIAALSPLAVSFANIAKPYAVDALIAALLLAATLKVRDSSRDRDWILLALSCAVAPFASTPSVFILAGTLLALFPGPEARRGPPLRRYLTVLGGVVLGAGVNYLLFQRAVSGDPYLQRFFASVFLWPLDGSLPGKLVESGSELVHRFYFMGVVHVSNVFVVLTLAIVGIGTVELHRRNGWRWTCLCLTPFIAVAGASVLRSYPLVNRLLMFLAPLLAVMSAAGLDYLVAKLVPRYRTLGLAVAAAGSLYLALLTNLHEIRRVHSKELAVRPMLVQYATSRSPGDPVYLYARTIPSWAFYTTDWSHPDRARINALMALARRIGPNSGNIPSRGRPVVHEGWDLVNRSGDHDELVGIPSGMEDRQDTFLHGHPDPGWADNEAARMRAAGGRQIWVVLGHRFNVLDNELEQAIVRAGGRIVGDRQHWWMRIWQVRFPTSQQPG
jgi:hypothetical protein